MNTISLRVLSVNMRRYRTNVDELTHTFVLKHNVDVMAVETFLDDRYVTTCDRIPSYSRLVRHNH